MKKSVRLLKAVADRNRLRIIKMLQHKDGSCVCEIQKILGVGQSTTSRHLRILEEADLICQVRDGKWINYFLNRKSHIPEVMSLLTLFETWLHEDRQVQADRERLASIDRSSLCQRE